MPLVTGTVQDIAGMPLTGLNPIIRFTPAGVAASPGGRVFTSKKVDVEPTSTGTFSVDLATTYGLIPNDAHWKIAILFRNPDGYDEGHGYTQVGLPGWKLRVPPEGGAIGPMIDAPAPANSLWIGLTPPPEGRGYQYWIDLSTNPAQIKEWQ